MKKLRSRLSLFSRKEGQPSASHNSGPTTAEARRRIKSWGSQLDMVDELERDRSFSCVSAKKESELLDCDDAIFLTSSDSAASALLGYAQEEQEMFEGVLKRNPLNPPALHVTSYWRLWSIKIKINLSGHKPPARASLPFFLNLHVEVEKEWKKQYFFSYS